MRLCHALIDGGEPVTLAAVDFGPAHSSPDFLRTFPLGMGPRRLGRSPELHRWLKAECATGTVSMLHNHGMWMMNAVYPAWVARGASLPLIQSTRGAFTEWAMSWGSKLKPLFWRLLQEPAMRAVTCFHATAESEYEDIRRLGFRQPVAVIPNGIDIPASAPKSGTGARTLLYLGRIHPNKGFDVLIPAWRAVQDQFPEWQLRIVGNDNDGYQARVEELVAKLGARRVAFTGPAYGDAKTLEYREADLFVLPSYSENFGMTVAESMAAGTPVIVGKGAPWSDVVREHAGWWVDVEVGALADAFREALSMPHQELADRGSRGRAWMARSFGWPDIAQRMAETYRWVLHESQGPAPAWIVTD